MIREPGSTVIRECRGRIEEEMEDVADMTLGELDQLLLKLKDELEDVEEERMFVLGQTGLHVSAGSVRKYEGEISSLRAKIEEVSQALEAKRAE
ncbi:MAG TPA: hypothetical protein VJP78_05310 [Thermoleophilia bacterium]|nr:hypothetical protein [Thermoleophilia bacterium]